MSYNKTNNKGPTGANWYRRYMPMKLELKKTFLPQLILSLFFLGQLLVTELSDDQLRALADYFDQLDTENKFCHHYI